MHTILIAEDDPQTCCHIHDLLEGGDFRLIDAQSSAAVLACYADSQPDLVLLDCDMPDLDGFAVCAQLNALYGDDCAPVLMLTNQEDEESIRRAFESGAADYLVKPVNTLILNYRVRTMLRMRDTQKALRARNDELNAFAYTVAHDLKTPIASLIGYAGLIENYHQVMPLDELNDNLERIVASGFKIRDIINALLLLAGAGRATQVQMQPLDMLSIVIAAQLRLTSLIDEFQPQIIIAEEWDSALGYDQWVEEIWANYLSNAIKYGGRPPRIEIGSVEQGEWVRYYVRDNGAGVSLEQQGRLFTPFTRLSELKLEGHGLGLSVVDRIVKKMGGQVGVDSTPGAGSTFWFTLPAIPHDSNQQPAPLTAARS
jgi:two-component system, sensor histidine kinase and response regulator